MKKRLITLVLILALAISMLALASCGEDPTPGPQGGDVDPATLIDNVVSYVKQQAEQQSQKAYGDFEVISSQTIRGCKFNVEWTAEVTTEGLSTGDQTVKVEAGSEGFAKINVYELSQVDFAFTLKANVKSADGKVSKEVPVTFSFEKPACIPMTFEQVKALESGASATVKGIVLAISSVKNGNTRNNIWMYNAEDGVGYEVYQSSTDPVDLGIEVGDTVCAMGNYKIYNNVYEFEKASFFIIEKNTGVPAAKDITAIYTSATDTKDPAFVELSGQLVTIKGVKITGEDLSNGYFNFVLAGKETYVRISSTECPFSDAKQATFKADHLAKNDWTANVTGLVNFYNGAMYLVPINENAFEYIEYVPTLPADKVAAVKAELTMPSKINLSGDTALATAGNMYSDVTIAWSFKEGATPVAAKIEDNTLKVTLGEKETITLVATLTCGTATDTKEFEIELASAQINWITAEKAMELAALLNGDTQETSAEKYFIYGTIIDNPTADYCNFHFVGTDEKTNGIVVYGLWANETERYGSKRQISTIPVSKGQTVFLYGNLQNYNGKLEITNALLLEAPEAGSCKENPLTGAQALEMAKLLDGNTKQTTEIKYYIKDVVLDAPTADYCNFHFVGLDEKTDGLIVYGLWQDADNRYGTKRQVAEIPFGMGYEVTLYGNLQNYDGKYEITNALLVSYEAPAAHVCTSVCAVCGGCKNADCTDPACSTKCSCPTGASHAGTLADPYTVADAIIEANKLASGAFGTDMVHVKGIITALTDKGTYYQNIYLVDQVGGTQFLVFSANETEQVKNPGIGDTVVVLGYLTKYYETLEMSRQTIGDTTYDVTFVAIERVSSAITIDAEHATVKDATGADLAATAENGTTISFKVTVEVGEVLDSVKVNGKEVTATNDVYTAIVAGPTTISVTTHANGQEPPKVVGAFVFGADYNSAKVSSYAGAFDVVCGGKTLALQNWNNNNNGWAFVKAGHKTTEYVATMTTASFTDKAISSIVVKIDSLMANSCKGAKLYVANNADFTGATEIAFTAQTGEVTINLTAPATGCYYKLAFDMAASSDGKTNGLLVVSGVDFYA